MDQPLQPLPFVPVEPDGQSEAPAGEPKPQGAKLPSNLSADPVVAGMQIGNFIAAAVYGPKGERR